MMLCFTVGTAGGDLAPLSIGCILMCMIYMGGAISGAHYNPAVTVAVLLRTLFGATHDEFSLKQAILYIPSQILGSLLGSLAAWGAVESNAKVGYPTVPIVSGHIGKGILGEALGTFLLAYTVLNVATVKQLRGNCFFGLAIGMVVTAMAVSIGPITGGAFNPAVGLIGAFSGGARVSIETIWVYWVACPIGAIAAAVFFRLQNFEEFHSDLDAAKFMAHAPHDQCHKQKYQAHICSHAPKTESSAVSETVKDVAEAEIKDEIAEL